MHAGSESQSCEAPGAKDLRLDSDIPSVDFQPQERASPERAGSPGGHHAEGDEEAPAGDPPEKPFVLSSEEQANMNLVILIRYLVMGQPIVGLFATSLALLAFYATRSPQLGFVVALCVPVALYCFSLYEVCRVSHFMKRNRSFALLYNAANKLLYCALLLALYRVHRSAGDEAAVVAAGVIIFVQVLFYVASLIYKRKQQIDQYVALRHQLVSSINYIILTQEVFLWLRLTRIIRVSYFVVLWPVWLSLGVYTLLCVYFFCMLFSEVSNLSDEQRKKPTYKVYSSRC